MPKLASWNVNSIKVRLNLVLEWMRMTNVDILAMQETKTMDEKFPAEDFKSNGLHVAFAGQKAYNGVAIASKFPITEVTTKIPSFDTTERRMIAATIGNLRLINLYVPNGAVVDSDKYQYKLEWLSKITDFIKQELLTYERVAVVGDFNIAPCDIDVYSPKAFAGKVLVSAKEREAFFKLIDLGLNDAFRLRNKELKAYSWWDYRAGGFSRNHGLRIDNILLNNLLNQDCVGVGIDAGPRAETTTSDHAPIWALLDLH